MAWECGLPTFEVVGTGLAISYLKKASFTSLENIMKNALKFETLMLQALFAACAVVCLLVMGSMLTTKSTVYVAASHASVAAVTGAKS